MKAFIVLLLAAVSQQAFSQKEYFISSSDQVKLRVREFGTGKPVVILSGGPGLNVNYMQAVWENLQTKYRCIVLDQRGTGQSPVAKVDSAAMSMENYVNDLESLRIHLGEEKLTLLGHSWGGMLAMQFAAAKPGGTAKLILVDPGGPTTTFFKWFGDNIMMRLQQADFKELAVLDSLRKPNLKGIWPGYFYDREMALKSKAGIDFETLHGEPGVNAATLGNYRKWTDQRIKQLKNFTGPVLLVQGRQDPIGESTIYEIKELLPQTQISMIEKCGHLPWLEKEDRRVIFYEWLEKALQ